MENLLMTKATLDTEAPSPAAQLRLVVGGREIAAVADRDWILDERTRTLGRYGIAQIRATLLQHRPIESGDSIAC
jgi:hypothetical protein